MGGVSMPQSKFDIAIEIAELNDRMTRLQEAINENTVLLDAIRHEIQSMPMLRFWRWLRSLFNV